MMEFLHWLEDSSVATTISSSVFLYPTILTLHSIGMAFVAGGHTAISLCILGVVPGIRLSVLTKYLPFIWFGFYLNLITGVLLVISSATRVLVDPIFFIKLVFVTLGLIALRTMRSNLTASGDLVYSEIGAGAVAAMAPVISPRMKRLAILSIVYWTAAITFGRLMAYTFYRLWQ